MCTKTAWSTDNGVQGLNTDSEEGCGLGVLVTEPGPKAQTTGLVQVLLGG